MHKTVFKYRINELLNQLSVKDYRKAMLLIPQLLNVSQRTFNNYRKIKLDDPQDIPYEKVVLLEKLLELQDGDLKNFNFTVPSIKEMDTLNQPAPLKTRRKTK